MRYCTKKADLIKKCSEQIIDFLPQHLSADQEFELSEHLTLVIDDMITNIEKFLEQKASELNEREYH
jgi:hypothetical protein